MALAYLWLQFLKSRKEVSLESHFATFVVDHKARPDSAEEAKLVASRLENLLGRLPKPIGM